MLHHKCETQYVQQTIFRNEHTINKTNDKRKSIVFNYPSVTLTEPMEKLLKKGLNFSVLPYKLDITQLLVEYK